MNKNKFLEELSKNLSKLPNKERKILIDFYSELIDDKIEGGQSEEEVIASFGSVNVLSERLLIENTNRKKSGCLYWAIGAIIFVVLIFLIIYLNFSHTKIDTISDSQTTASNSQTTGIPTSEQGDFKVISYNYKDIEEVALDASISKIIIEKSNDENINIKYKEYDDEINRVELDGRTLEFDNELKRNKPNTKSERTIYLEIPEDFKGYLDVSADLGTVKIQNFNLAKIDLSADLGSIEITDCRAVDIELSSDMGSVFVNNTIAERSLEASSDMGSLEVKDIDASIIELSTEMGTIKGKMLGKQEEYSIIQELGLGTSNLANQNGGTKSLKVSADMGSIDLSFTK